uniref:Uncharacterized protein n=1 Tax=Romanomermis culicivorax TaxID=13658 RepID=A0A915JWI1_ROMCU
MPDSSRTHPEHVRDVGSTLCAPEKDTSGHDLDVSRMRLGCEKFRLVYRQLRSFAKNQLIPIKFDSQIDILSR